MGCKNVCKLCNRLIISTAVTYTAPNLVITIPAGGYNNCQKYCIVVAQAIPTETTVDAPVMIQIGDGPVLYPLQNCNGRPVTARNVFPRRKYSTRVVTTTDSGIFRLLGNICCQQTDNLQSINGEGTPAAATAPTV